MRTTLFLLLVFAISIAIATFVENDYGTDSAKALIYNAKWFEFLLFILVINLIGNIKTHKMYRKEKMPIFLFHLSFIIIFVGAGITRFAGLEGTMSIREGETSNTMVSMQSYFQLKIENEQKRYTLNHPLLPSPLVDNSFSRDFEIEGKEYEVELVDYIVSATSDIKEIDNGEQIVSLALALGNSGRKDIALERGESLLFGEKSISFEDMQNLQSDFFIRVVDDSLHFSSGYKIGYYNLKSGEQGELQDNTLHKLEKEILYQSNNLNLVFKDYKKSGEKIYKAGNPKDMDIPDLFRFKLSSDDKEKEFEFFGKNGAYPSFISFDFDGLDFRAGFGSKVIELPFSIRLNDFQLERYPGSMSPSSYASEVSVIDDVNGEKFDYRIYMNHILEYMGYRFYQASYDVDEQGTILSVNKDFWGTMVTYFGYFVMGLGMFAALFSAKGRARKLYSSFSRAAPLFLALFLVFASTSLEANENNLEENIVKDITSIDKEHAKKFGNLITQDSGGRLKPIDTLAHEVLNKVSGQTEIFGLEASEILLGMVIRPNAWQNVKMIKISHPELKELLGLDKKDTRAAFVDFFDFSDGEMSYKLEELISSASRKRPAMQDKLDKDILKVDERLNISYMIFTGSLIRILPKPNDPNQKWYAPIEAFESFEEEDAKNTQTMIYSYFQSIDSAIESGNWEDSDKILAAIEKYQRFYGASVYPSEKKIKAEILYNKVNIFERLMPLYLFVGLILLTLSIIHIIKPVFNIKIASKISVALFGLGFILHTIGLGFRWYISGHAPWSDGYESMIYIAWATILAGFIFVRNSPIALSATGVLSGLTLFVAHLSWMDPQITNLVPVLDSYWLIIHVSMITASYGFLGLGALLGFIALLLYIIRNRTNFENITKSIKEISYINEISLIIGLVLLTIGNFLGGVWANESWGRYWGWDPKETWALVTIIVYAIVVHLRFVPNLNDKFIFNVASLVSFSSVIMTYFGVNFYLSGLHSYAKGDPVPVPLWIYITTLVILFMIVFSYFRKEMVEKSIDKNNRD